MRNLILLSSLAVCAHARWLNYPDPRTARTKDGKPNFLAPARRMNAKPDLSGLWEADETPRSELDRVLGSGFFDIQIDVPKLSKYVINLLWDFKPENDPSRPEVLDLLKQLGESSTWRNEV